MTEPLFAVAQQTAAEVLRAHHASGVCAPIRSPRPMASLVSSWPVSSVVVVKVCGDIDVTNSATMTAYALIHAISGRGLILDLTGVEFFGTEGFSALHRIAVSCALTGTFWSFVPGAAVSRLLRVCDPGGWLPAADTVDVALAAFGHLHHRPPGLVADSRLA